MALLHNRTTDLKLANQPCQLTGLLNQGMACGRRLFNHGGVLLRDLIHLVHGRVDLSETGSLLMRS